MVATLVLIQDENGNLHDPDDHLRYEVGHRLDDQEPVIPDLEAVNLQAANVENAAANAQAVAEEKVQAARPRTLTDNNRSDQYYANRYAICPPTF